MPTHTTFGLEGARVMAPIDDVDWPVKTGSQVVPWLVVFHTPPVAVPT